MELAALPECSAQYLLWAWIATTAIFERTFYEFGGHELLHQMRRVSSRALSHRLAVCLELPSCWSMCGACMNQLK